MKVKTKPIIKKKEKDHKESVTNEKLREVESFYSFFDIIDNSKLTINETPFYEYPPSMPVKISRHGPEVSITSLY